MAFRTLIITTGLVLAIFCSAPQSKACFGPKLYVGVGQGAAAEVMYALVTLYVQEKTGVESIRVELAEDHDPFVELQAERLDLVFAIPGSDDPASLLALADYPALYTGERPRNDLQFTTVLPAIRKLAGLLVAADVDRLTGQVQAGESAMAVVRRLLTERRWI